MPRPAPRQTEPLDEPSGVAGKAAAALLRRPVDAFAGLLAAACAGMILVNALALQQGKPAAPARAAAPASAWTTAPKPERRTDAPKRDELVAQVQTAIAERGLYDGVVDGVMGPGTAAAIRGFEQGQGMAQTVEASEKTLAALMTAPARKAAAKPAPQPAPVSAPPSVTGSTVPGPRLMAAQKALAKIGYGPVTIDGRMGLETRNAIKAFERDRGMSETGELTPQVARALQQMTGAPLQ